MKLRRYTVNIINIMTSDPAHVHRRCFTAAGAKRSRDRVQANLNKSTPGSYIANLRVYVR